VPQRDGGGREAQRLQALLRRGRRQPRLVGRQRRHRAQQRPVEQLLVQPAHHPAVAGALPGEGGQRVAAVTHRAGQPSHRHGVVVRREQVGAAQLVQLQPVLHRAQPAVGLGEVARVLPADVAAAGELLERDQRGAAAHVLVGPAVHQLQQLDGELDVAQPAGPELDLARGAVAAQRLLDPAAHRLHVRHEVGPAGGLPDQRRDPAQVVGAEREVARPSAAP
jgi:hypothetical protein